MLLAADGQARVQAEGDYFGEKLLDTCGVGVVECYAKDGGVGEIREFGCDIGEHHWFIASDGFPSTF